MCVYDEAQRQSAKLSVVRCKLELQDAIIQTIKRDVASRLVSSRRRRRMALDVSYSTLNISQTIQDRDIVTMEY